MQYYDKLGTCFRINLSFSNGGQTNQNFFDKNRALWGEWSTAPPIFI